MSSARERLTRLLSLVPYLDAHPGADLEETAAYFGIDSTPSSTICSCSSSQVDPDICPMISSTRPGKAGRYSSPTPKRSPCPCGSAPRKPASSCSRSTCSLPCPDSIPKPWPQQHQTACSGRKNLRTAVDVSPIDADEELLTALRQAVEEGTAMSIDYYVGSRDELTTRTIAPTRLVPGADWYVDAWCYSAGAPRRFALGRIRSWEPAAHPPMSVSGSTTSSYEVTLGLGAAGAWLADELDVTNREYLDGGDTSVRIRLLVHSVDWLSRFLLCHADVITEIDDTEAVAAALHRLG